MEVLYNRIILYNNYLIEIDNRHFLTITIYLLFTKITPINCTCIIIQKQLHNIMLFL